MKEIPTMKMQNLNHSQDNPLYIYIHSDDVIDEENFKKEAKKVQCIPNSQIRIAKRIPKKNDFQFN